MFELTQQRREFNSLQRADSCFPTPLGTESLYTRILVGLKERFKACVSNAFREIFQFHIAPLDERLEYIAYLQNWNNLSPILVRDRRMVTDAGFLSLSDRDFTPGGSMVVDPRCRFLVDAAGFVGYISAMAAHDHDHNEGSNLSEVELRVRALETILVDKRYIEPAALDRIVELYETKIGPHIGAQVIAKAWSDPAFRQSLLEDASKAVNAFTHVGNVGEHLIAVENTPQVHNMIVCTLCSCYPTDVLGLPPAWYKSFAYRSRAVKEPRAVLADFGVALPAETEIRVWDSTAETRYVVVPMRPAGTEGWSEAQLAKLITRDSMIGAGLPKKPSEVA